MRPNVDYQKIERLMQVLGKEAQGAGCIYFTGGASALLIGWRSSTVDVDIRLDPEPPGIFQAIAKLKQELNINIELASPQDFLPPLPGWRDRSVFIGKQGQISFYHYDFTAQALFKLSRGFDRDIKGCISLLRICQKMVKMKKLVKSSNKDEVKKMTPSDQQQLKAHLKAAAEILYRNTDPIELKSFESIEKSVRQKMLSEVGPELGSFFFQQYQELKQENREK